MACCCLRDAGTTLASPFLLLPSHVPRTPHTHTQCFAIPGYGRTSTKDARGNVVYWGVLCSKGTFNVGGNTRLCQTCPQGLTTQSAGADSASDCREWPCRLAVPAP